MKVDCMYKLLVNKNTQVHNKNYNIQNGHFDEKEICPKSQMLKTKVIIHPMSTD